jgi:hypothetical protein
MLAVAFTLTTKHLGIAIASICIIVLVYLVREDIQELLGDIADGICDAKNAVCENVRERIGSMGIVCLLAATGFGIALICGTSLASAGIVTGIILLIILFCMAVDCGKF